MKNLTIRARWRSSAVVLGVACVVSALIGGAALHGSHVDAQEKPPVKSDAAAIVVELDDIDRLRVLNPLKLQPDQLDKLATALSSAQADYDKKVKALGEAVFGPTAGEVQAMKKQVLGGGAVPKEFEDKIKKLQADFLKQRDELNTANIQHVASACKMVLTDTQVAAATKLERDQWEKDHTDSKNVTDTQLFNLYCVDMFISNPRAVPLLKEMRAAVK